MLIILEVALYNSILINCMDGTVRDLADLRGTYKLIDKTDVAIKLLGEKLNALKVKNSILLLGSTASNSEKLKSKIIERLKDYTYGVETNLVNNPDLILAKLDNVISSYVISLNKYKSCTNINLLVIMNKSIINFN